MLNALLKKRGVRVGSLPEFGINMGFTLTYLSLIVLIPLAAFFIKSTELSWDQFWTIVSSRRVVASLKLTFGMALAAAIFNAVFGLILAWIVVRYDFAWRRVVDALIDLPTAVAGIALASLFSTHGWIGRWLPFPVTNYPIGIFIAMTFISLPFAIRTAQSVLQDVGKEQEEVSACLGANRFQTIFKVMLPAVFPVLLTGVALAFARAVGEYGSIIFIAGNTSLISEITALVIVIRLEQFDYAGASAIAVVMLFFSFLILLGINTWQWWLQSRHLRSTKSSLFGSRLSSTKKGAS